MQLTHSIVASLFTISAPLLCYRARSMSLSQTLARSWVPRQTPLFNGVATLAPVAINYFSTPGGQSMQMLLPITNRSPSCITGVLDTYDAPFARVFDHVTMLCIVPSWLILSAIWSPPKSLWTGHLLPSSDCFWQQPDHGHAYWYVCVVCTFRLLWPAVDEGVHQPRLPTLHMHTFIHVAHFLHART